MYSTTSVISCRPELVELYILLEKEEVWTANAVRQQWKFVQYCCTARWVRFVTLASDVALWFFVVVVVVVVLCFLFCSQKKSS